MNNNNQLPIKSDYEWGFTTNIDQTIMDIGLNEEIISKISKKKNEPKWLLDWRLDAFEIFKNISVPEWSDLKIDPIDFQKISYYAELNAPKYDSLDDLPKELLETYEKLGIPLTEQKRLNGIAIDVVFDSVSVGTIFQKELEDLGIIFCSFSDAVQKYPELVKKYLGSVVPKEDNFYAALNSAVFTDGSFAYIPPNTKCPMELSTYFRLNAKGTGQFERTLLIADDGASVSYLEGCTAPSRDENQLHAAVVELIALDNAEIKYSTVQNWYPGDKDTGKGGVYNFVTKRAKCKGKNSKVSWTQVETGSSITWKYPSCILQGDGSQGEFYSIAVSNNFQQADTGSKMIHIGKNTKSKIVSKGICLRNGQQTYRGKVDILKTADGSRNFTQCDSMIIGKNAKSNTIPYIMNKSSTSIIEHEASVSKISDDQLEYLLSRGLDEEKAISLIVNGFVRDIIKRLPFEFVVEATKLLELSLEGSVG